MDIYKIINVKRHKVDLCATNTTFEGIILSQSLTVKCNTKYWLGAFHLVRTHLGVCGVKPPVHFHRVLHAKQGLVGPDSM